MPNALNAAPLTQHRILALGSIGSGKTMQITTLPGRKWVYCFDSNALLTLRGYDVDYEEILPDAVSGAVKPLGKGKAGDPQGSTASRVYMEWEQTFDERLKTGFFDQYDWICIDSATTLLDLIMDRVTTLNNRYGKFPEQDDWGPQMQAFTNVCRTLIGLGKGIYMTGHFEAKEDPMTKILVNRPMLTGKLVNKIPLLFSDIFFCDAQLDDKGQSFYRIQTKPSVRSPSIRCSIQGLDAYEDVTIDLKQNPVGQGLGGVLGWWQKQLASKATTSTQT